VPHRGKHPEDGPHGVGEREAWVYMVLCSDGTLYTGWTFDLEARMKAHNEGRGARYTSGRRPVKRAYCEKVQSKSEALRREMAIKKMPGPEKRRLAAAYLARFEGGELPWEKSGKSTGSPGST
jgi:putative endonuclease